MSTQLEEFLKAKPRIDFLIAILKTNIMSGPRKNRFFILFFILFDVLYVYFLILHMKETIKCDISINFLLPLLISFIMIGYGVRMIVGILKKDKIEVLMKNIMSLYEENEEDEVIKGILENHLKDSIKVYLFLNKWTVRLFILATVCTSLYFRLNDDYGLMYALPFNVPEGTFWKETLFILQGFFIGISSLHYISSDLGIIFLAIQLIAEFKVLNDCMKLLNERIKTNPKFFRKIIERHCLVIRNANLLSDIISETAFMQLLNSCLTLLFVFSFLLKYLTGIGNYAMIIIAATLSLPICFIGEFIRVKSNELSETLWLINWYELSLKDQRIFLIVLRMAQREYGLKAAGMYSVGFYTFLKILKIAFSYSAILYSLSK
uniref:Odorant receptor n=1 Tax=Lutzomyia longipalpis TaxID=7200 RepID=A0A3F2ZD71_LUTLO